MAVLIRARFDSVDLADLVIKSLKESGVAISSRSVFRDESHDRSYRVPSQFRDLSDFSPLPSASAVDGAGIASMLPSFYGAPVLPLVMNDAQPGRFEAQLEIAVPEECADLACHMLRSRGGHQVYRMGGQA